MPRSVVVATPRRIGYRVTSRPLPAILLAECGDDSSRSTSRYAKAP